MPVESCSAEILGLARFSQTPKQFAADKKEAVERLLNPFGDPWGSRRHRNPLIPVMTGSTRGLVRARQPEYIAVVEGKISEREIGRYRTFQSNAGSRYHYDETVSKIAPDMPEFRRLKASFERFGIYNKIFIGYAVVNYDDGLLFPPGSNLPETCYLHNPVHSLRKEDRVKFDDPTLIASGYVFDIRRPEVQDMLAKAISDHMIVNGVDAVLIDYAIRPFAFGLPSLLRQLPEEWFDGFQEHQYALIAKIYKALFGEGKQLFLNGVMLDSIVATDPAFVRTFLKCSHGLFWEQPFRWEWRDYNDNGCDYYQRLGQFFEAFVGLKKTLIVKSGSYRFHGTEDIRPSFTSRFAYTDHGIERHLAQYLTCFFLLYYNRHYMHLLHTHPTELLDIFSSEAYFKFWDTNLGEVVGPRFEVAKHVHMREFENGIVFVNNQIDPFKVSDRLRPKGFKRGLPRLVLEPLSGTFFPYKVTRVKRQALRALGRAISPRRRLQAVRQWLGV